jgi:hypothetical protein
MSALALRHAAVWLDELAPEGGAFAHAVEWASRLGLSLHGVTSTLRMWGGRLTSLPWSAGGRADDATPCVLPAEKLEACATACARRGVPWNASLWQGPLVSGIDQFLRPLELCIFGDALPPRLKEQLLRQSLHSPDSSVLVCPRSWQPVARVLVLHEHRNPANHFLDAAAEVCHAFGTIPVVLTVARTEREARLRRRFAEERFGSRRQAADFDCIIGCDVRTAVAWVARWRRCSHIFVERDSAPPWWRWLRGDTLQRLFGLADGLTFLALPGRGPAFRPLARAGLGPTTGKATKT